MSDDKREVHNQAAGSQSGQTNPTQGADKGAPGKQGEQSHENQPGQQTPKKDVHSDEKQHEHQKTGSR